MWLIIASVLSVFLVIAVGALCRRLGWLTQEADHSLANLTAQVLLPAYFINKILADGTVHSGDGVGVGSVLIPPLFGFVTTAIGFALARVFARYVGPRIGITSDSQQRAFALCVGICNYGYIPYPLAETFSPDAMIDLILHNVGVELALWSIGILIISGRSVPASDTKDPSSQPLTPAWKRAIFSGPLLAVVIASSLRASGGAELIPLPVMTAISTLAACAIPMGLMLSGAIIIEYAGDFIRGPSIGSSLPVIGSAIAIRQLAMPILMLGATKLLANGLAGTHMIEVMTIQAAMPVAIFPIVLVRLYDRDTRTAIEVIVSTSIAGIITIPVWLAIGTWWLS